MKKILLLTLIITCLSAMNTRHALSILRIDATDITIGATAWYAWMERYTDNFPTEKLGSALLYGPALSVKFDENFNLTFIFLYGVYDSFDRRDSDLALNYRLSDYFKVFAGVKYMGFTDALKQHNAVGPGLGVSATVPITGDIFLLATMSGLYLWGSEKYDDSIVNEKESFNEYGINGTLAFAYYIADFSTVISLGARYQYYKTDYKEYTLDYKTACYGITLTATYTF